ncbi:MAG: hypothetical protein FWG78_01490 [Coriobacteriia bacterium]|nr:hypothetical protein [Coriobacteriia bacterium]
MAVARMRKVTAIVNLELLDTVITTLQKSGVLEVTSTARVIEHELPTIKVPSDDTALAEVETDLAKARYIRETLAPHHKNEQPMAMFVSEKFHLTEEAYRAAAFDYEFEGLYATCEDITAAIAEIKVERSEIAADLRMLKPWARCPIPFTQWHGTETTAFYAGTALPAQLARIHAAFSEADAPIVDLEEFGPKDSLTGADEATKADPKAKQAFIVRMFADDEQAVRTLLHRIGADETRFDEHLVDTPAHEIAVLKEHCAAHGKRLTAHRLELRAMAKRYYTRTTILIEALKSARERVTVRSNFAHTETVFVITGWVRQAEEETLAQVLKPFKTQVDLTFEDPGPQDTPPVELENPTWLKPFELLTDLYGRPTYGRLDPTPFFAPFFVFFVAVCIGDVGYGLVMAAVFFAIMSVLDVAPGVKNFCRLMIYGGIAAVPVGVMLGGYFALPHETLPSFLQHMRIIDPLADIMTFLVASVVIGVIQLTAGIVIAVYQYVRGGQWQVALGSKMSIFVLVGFIAAFVLSGAEHLWMLLTGIGLTVLLQGFGLYYQIAPEERTPKRAVTSVFGGMYEVYGMTGLLNDALSYMRLAALALAGALVGMVFNILAGMMMEPAMASFGTGDSSIVTGVLLIVAVVLIFVVGHSFNVAISLIGAFVHPMRLQFVEFFGMFYSAGGVTFKPLAYKKDNLVFEGKEK